MAGPNTTAFALAPFTGGASLLIPGAKALGIGQNPSFNAPTQQSNAVQQAAATEAAKRRRAAGYQSTILTVPQQQQLKETTGA